jgi:hypothetical protein
MSRYVVGLDYDEILYRDCDGKDFTEQTAKAFAVKLKATYKPEYREFVGKVYLLTEVE